MRLSTRLTAAMLAHAFITVGMLAVLNYRVFEATDVPNARERFQRYPRGLAAELEAATAGLKEGVLELQAAPAIREIVRGSREGAGPAGAPDQHLAVVAAQCARLLAAFPILLQCRLVGVAAGDRNIVRVDRAAREGGIQVMRDTDMAQPGADGADQELIRRTFDVGIGEIFASGVEVDRQRAPARLSVAAPVRSPDGAPFGVVVITADIGPALAEIAASGTVPRPILLAQLPRRMMFVIDKHGRYLVSPDSAGELGLAVGPSARLQDDFPGLTEANWQIDEIGPILMKDRSGQRFAVGFANARLVGERRVVIVQTFPFSAAASSTRTMAITTLIAGAFAVLGAIADHASAHDTAPASALQHGHETILVVEDDPLVRNFVTSQLESLGYTPVAAANATEALALVERGQAFDLLFTDIVMPGGMNGRELAREIARRRPGTRVLYTSGYTENAITHHGRLDPDVALLTKPYRKVDLAQIIRKALDATPAA